MAGQMVRSCGNAGKAGARIRSGGIRWDGSPCPSLAGRTDPATGGPGSAGIQWDGSPCPSFAGSGKW